MKIAIKTDDRRSVAYHLSPGTLTVLLPETGIESGTLQCLQSAKIDDQKIRELGGNLSREQIADLLQEWSARLDVSPRRVQVRSLKGKWASCSTAKNLTLSDALLNMPREFVEYVICHELLHLKVRKHNKLFRSLLNAHMPDWEGRVTSTIESLIGSPIGTPAVVWK